MEPDETGVEVDLVGPDGFAVTVDVGEWVAIGVGVAVDDAPGDGVNVVVGVSDAVGVTVGVAV